MRIITRNSDNVVVMFSDNGKPEFDEATQKGYDLSPDQELLFIQASRQANGGVTFDGTNFDLLPAPPPPPPVASASPAQFRRELRRLNKLDAVKALIATQDEETQEDFEYATEFRSDSPKLLALAAAPGIDMTPQDVFDALTRAAQINIGV